MNWLFMQDNTQKTAAGASTPPYVDDDFAGLDEAVGETGFDTQDGIYHDEEAGSANVRRLSANLPVEQHASMAEIESIMASLIQQALLQGYLTHNNPRFAIPGAKEQGPLARGFPNVWQKILTRADDNVPGWVKEDDAEAPGGRGFGSLTGARPVGVF